MALSPWKLAYQRDYRRGLRRPRPPLELRLLAKIEREHGDLVSEELGRCWNWLGALNGDGYGVIRGAGRRLELAHRVSLSLALGRPIREGMQANHRCDTRYCVRPRHLYEGTPTENNEDMYARHRR